MSIKEFERLEIELRRLADFDSSARNRAEARVYELIRQAVANTITQLRLDQENN